MVKLIIFDLSGVLFNDEEREYLKEFSEKNKLNYDELYLYYSKFIEMAERNEVTLEYVWAKVFKRFNINQDIAATIKGVVKLKKVDNSMLDVVKELRRKHKTVYATNYAKGYWEFIERKFPFSDYFDYGVVSYKIGFRKPSKEGFEDILKRFGVKAGECVYTDDKDENLKEAKAIGMKVVHFKGREEFLKEMKRILG